MWTRLDCESLLNCDGIEVETNWCCYLHQRQFCLDLIKLLEQIQNIYKTLSCQDSQSRSTQDNFDRNRLGTLTKLNDLV